MGRRPDPEVAAIKESLRLYLTEALDLQVGLVLHASSARDYVLGLAKQVKKTDVSFDGLAVRPGSESDEIYIVKKVPEL